MKRKIVLLACLITLIAANQLQAQPIQNKLIGVWQMCYPKTTDGATRMVYMPVWKNINDDGTFCTFMWQNGQNSAVITNRGSYKVETNNQYTEYVAETSTSPRIAQKENKLTFNFHGNDLLEVSYRIPGANEDGIELWKRIKVDSPETLGEENAQQEAPQKRASNGVYHIAEQMPEYPGGTTAMMTRITQTAQYPAALAGKGGEATATIRFIVDEKGEVVSTEIFTSAGTLFDAEAIRVIKDLKFKPGKEKGVPVKVYMTVPVSFKP